MALETRKMRRRNRGYVSISVSKELGYVDVVIKDTGHGMDDRFIRENLFRPFFSTKGTQGMGIGAYQIRETMRMFGGDVVVDSSVDGGTEVRLRIPSIE